MLLNRPAAVEPENWWRVLQQFVGLSSPTSNPGSSFTPISLLSRWSRLMPHSWLNQPYNKHAPVIVGSLQPIGKSEIVQKPTRTLNRLRAAMGIFHFCRNWDCQASINGLTDSYHELDFRADTRFWLFYWIHWGFSFLPLNSQERYRLKVQRFVSLLMPPKWRKLWFNHLPILRSQRAFLFVLSSFQYLFISLTCSKVLSAQRPKLEFLIL